MLRQLLFLECINGSSHDNQSEIFFAFSLIVDISKDKEYSILFDRDVAMWKLYLIIT